MKCVLAIVGLLLVATPVSAQTLTASSLPLWFDQPAPDLATANRYTYTLYVDGVAQSPALAVTCMEKLTPVPQLYDCTSVWPALTPGKRDIQVGTKDVLEAKSVVTSFVFTVVPAEAKNLRVVRE